MRPGVAAAAAAGLLSMLMSAIVGATSVQAEEIVVLSTGAAKEALIEIIPLFERASGHKINITFGQGPATLEKVRAGATGDLFIGPAEFSQPLVKEGKLRALGIARAERWPALPAVPTLVESGFPDFTHDAWTGVVAPAGTPRDVLDTLNRAINDGLQSAEMKENLIRFSAIAKPGTPQDFAAFMQSEVPKWAELVKLAGATAD